LDGVLADRLHDVAHGARAEFVRIGDSNVPCLCPRLSTGNRREERFQLCNSQTSAPSELLRRPLAMTGRAAHVALRDLSKDDRPRPARRELCDFFLLQRRIAMVEVKDDDVGFPAIDARVYA